MNALLAQALVTVTHEYEQRGAGSVSLPTLAVWSNVLRPVGDGIDLRELPAAARLSKRAVRAAVGAAVKARVVGPRRKRRAAIAIRRACCASGGSSLDADVEASVAGDVRHTTPRGGSPVLPRVAALPDRLRSSRPLDHRGRLRVGRR